MVQCAATIQIIMTHNSGINQAVSKFFKNLQVAPKYWP